MYVIYSMKRISLYCSVFLFPRDMHLEEWLLFFFFFFFWSITVMAVDVWESGRLSPTPSFSAGSCWSNSQLHCAISRVSGFVVCHEAARARLWVLLKRLVFFTMLSDCCPLNRAGWCHLCMYGDNRTAWNGKFQAVRLSVIPVTLETAFRVWS